LFAAAAERPVQFRPRDVRENRATPDPRPLNNLAVEMITARR
jgi:hypothetical protein